MEEIDQVRLYENRADVPEGVPLIDVVADQVAELFYIEHPAYRPNQAEAQAACATYQRESNLRPVYAYYPWRTIAIALVPEAAYTKIRTARNRNLITSDEQAEYRAARVAVAGLSVGSTILSSLVMTGGPRYMRIADPDTIELSNLNRIAATVLDYGAHKAVVAARRVWEIDPYAHIDVWKGGISADTAAAFVDDVEVVIDEIDTIATKLALREACRARRVPLLMATDNGDGTLLDVERYDEDVTYPAFHGALGAVTADELAHLDRAAWIRAAVRVIQPAAMVQRLATSLLEVGTTLSGASQLGTGAAVSGAIVATAVRRIVTGAPLPSGRYVIMPEALLDPTYASEPAAAERAQTTRVLAEALGIDTSYDASSS